MGVSQSVQRSKEVKRTVQKEESKDKILIEHIYKKSKELYKKNKENFLSEDFCNKLSITYSKKLQELPIKEVKSVYDQLEN